MIGPDEMMQPARRAAAIALVAGALAARGAEAGDEPRLRLFPEAGEASPPPKRPWLVAAEMALLEFIPFARNRFVEDEDYARISAESIRRNFEVGFSYDPDKFTTNQLGHTIAGGLFFNAPRSNGYSFWESAPFVLLGSAFWEYFAETQGPSFNDLVNTTLGGITLGESSYRLSQFVLDDRTRGGARVAREALAGVINPTQFLTRVFTGEAWAVRGERGTAVEPSRFVSEIDAGWRHVSDLHEDADQGFVSAAIRYGDPFDRAVSRPFDAFDLAADLSYPSAALLTRVEIRGLLGGRELGAGPGARHVLGAFMGFDYSKNDARVYSSQSFPFGLLSLTPLGNGVELRTEALGAVVPLAALENDHPDASSGLVGRTYDYGPGAGIRAAVRLRRRELDLATLAYSLTWMHTSNGVMRNSTLQSFRAEARTPVAGDLALGASWAWGQRISTYDEFDTVRATATRWGAFLSWIYR